MAIGMIAALSVQLMGDGSSTSITLDADKISEVSYGTPVHYGKLDSIVGGMASCFNQYPPFGIAPVPVTVSPGNKFTFAFTSPIPIGSTSSCQLQLVFVP